MEDNPRRRRLLGWLLLTVGVVVIGGFVVATLLQKPAPAGKEIVNKPIPAKHWTDACFACHKGMPPGAALRGKTPPEKHPTQGCANCHKDYRAEAKASSTAAPTRASAPAARGSAETGAK